MNPWTPGEVFYAVLAAVCGTFTLTVLFLYFRSMWGLVSNKADEDVFERIRRFEKQNVREKEQAEKKNETTNT